ncbi:MAG: hypothetical protein IPG90_04035 [Bacteroidetes bacterium]|nr:hypothetical protein [Bacteroidota bacterium]
MKKQNKVENRNREIGEPTLQLNEQKIDTKLASRVSALQGKIDFCETQINQIVYELSQSE